MEKIRFTPKSVTYSEAHFLSGDEQSRYKEAVKQFKNERAQNSLRIPRNGSNLFKVLFLNQIGIGIATLAELDQIILADEAALRGTYEDAPAVVLRSNRDSCKPNDYLAKSLARLVRKRSFKNPLVISGLKLFEDTDSTYGLGFKEGRSFSFFECPELSHSNNRRRFTRQDERGMPIFDDNGNRTLYTKGNGVSGLCLYGSLDLFSGNQSLAVSDEYGRVVVVSGEATSPKNRKR